MGATWSHLTWDVLNLSKILLLFFSCCCCSFGKGTKNGPCPWVLIYLNPALKVATLIISTMLVLSLLYFCSNAAQGQQFKVLPGCCCWFFLSCVSVRGLIVQHFWKKKRPRRHGEEHMCPRQSRHPRPSLLRRWNGTGQHGCPLTDPRKPATVSDTQIQMTCWAPVTETPSPSLFLRLYAVSTRTPAATWWLIEPTGKMAQKDTLLHLFAGG